MVASEGQILIILWRAVCLFRAIALISNKAQGGFGVPHKHEIGEGASKLLVCPGRGPIGETLLNGSPFD